MHAAILYSSWTTATPSLLLLLGVFGYCFDASLLRRGTTNPTELYDLATDMTESDNCINEPALTPVVRHLSELALKHWDLLVANILAGPLITLRDTLLALLKPGGSLLLSGLLDSQAPELIEHYRQHIRLEIAAERDHWVCLSGRRPD